MKGTLLQHTVLNPNYLLEKDAYDHWHSYPPERFLALSGMFIWLLLPVTIYVMYKKRQFNHIQGFYAIWFISFIPLIVLAWWRWWSYALIPATLFISSVISKYIDKHDTGKKDKGTSKERLLENSL